MRFLTLQRIFLLVMILVWGGLFSTQILHGPDFKEQSEKNRTRLVHLPAARGNIVDRFGEPLAIDKVSFELSAFPQELSEPAVAWDRLATLLDMEPGFLAKQYRKHYRAPFYRVPLVRDLPPETAFMIEEMADELPGIFIQPVPRRSYPLGKATGPLLGYLGLIAPEELTRLKPYGYTVRDRVGKDGIEQVYDRFLRGQDGGLHVEVNSRGQQLRQLAFLPPQKGRPIQLSVDGRLQSFVYSLVDQQPGAVAVMDLKTGEVLALVSSPGFDSGAFVDATRSEELHTILGDPRRPLFNRVTRALVAPGSTFKSLVAYKALSDQKASPTSTVECPGYFMLGRSKFRCWYKPGHKTQNVADALAHSCNVYFYDIGLKLGPRRLAQVARTFHLGKRTGIDLPRENKGFVPDPEWMQRKHNQNWQKGDTVSFAVGQSALQTTPLQMMVAFSALANEGAVPFPQLIKTIDGDPVKHRMPRSLASLNHSRLVPVKIGMEQVVASETGTGRLARQEGFKVAGKTGTAQAPGGKSHAWFCGYAPAQRPRYSFVVFLEHGGQGGYHAAKVVQQMMQHMQQLEYF